MYDGQEAKPHKGQNVNANKSTVITCEKYSSLEEVCNLFAAAHSQKNSKLCHKRPGDT